MDLSDGGLDIDRLAEEFLERRRRGEPASVEEYATAHPELATEIREFFSTLVVIEDLGDSLACPTAEPLSSETTRAPGLQHVGEFRILRELGRGGMGVVYEAEQASLKRPVALKVLPFHSLLDSKQIERFQQEARAAARLSHPNIVPVYGVGEHLGVHYYVMQLIPGQGLDRVIEEVRRQRESGHASDEDSQTADDSSTSSLAIGLRSGSGRSGPDRYFQNVARLARDAALALDYAHGERVLHRDVKPSNLLLDPTGRVWLTDFGLAKAEGSDNLTRSGDFVGTVRYMAPERFKGWADPRSDVYGLGITLYELLTLRPAFVERDRTRLLRRVMAEEPPAPRRIDRSVPRDLEKVVLKSIAIEPSLRYASAQAMADDLDRFLEGRPVEARRSNAAARLVRWFTRNPVVGALAVAVILLLVTIAVISSTLAIRLAREQAGRREELRAAYLAEASAIRRSGEPGRRFRALEATRDAAQIRPGLDLVDEAIASLSQVDVRERRRWKRVVLGGLAMTADGATVAIATPRGEVSIRDVESDRELVQLPGVDFAASYCRCVFSPGGRFLAVRSEAGTSRRVWRVWEVDRRRISVEVLDPSGANCAMFAPDESWVALDQLDGSLRIFDLATGAGIASVRPGFSIEQAAVHPGGRLIAITSRETDRVHIYDREEERVLLGLEGTQHQSFSWLAWHPDGRTLAAASLDHQVYVWNVPSGERIRILQGHWAEAVWVEFSPDGSGLLASRGWDPSTRFWDPGSDRPLFTIHGAKNAGFGSARSFWIGTDEELVLHELTASLPAFTLVGHEILDPNGRTAKHPRAISIAPGGRLAASGGDDGIRLWDLVARQELAHLPGASLRSVHFDATGSALYGSGNRGLVRWPIRAAGTDEKRLEVGPAERLGSLDGLQCAALGDRDRRVAVIHEETHIHVIEAISPERSLRLDELAKHRSIAFSPDGAWIASGDRAAEIRIWNAHDGHIVHRLPGTRAGVAFDPTGEFLATSSAEGCTLVRVADWRPVWHIAWRAEPSRSGLITFDRSGKLLATTRDESKIWLLDVERGRRLAELEAPEPVQVSALALQDAWLAAATSARRIHVWNLAALARDLAAHGLDWELPVDTSTLAAASSSPRLRVTVVDDSDDGHDDGLLDPRPDLAADRLFLPSRLAAFEIDVASFRDLDLRLEAPSFLIGQGDRWRFFRGRSDPSPGLEWTETDHDHSRWEDGASEFCALPGTPGVTRTLVEDQFGAYTTLYLRHSFQVRDPTTIARVIFAAEVEDGLVAYLNGQEIGRVNAGAPGTRLAFYARAGEIDARRVTLNIEIPRDRLRSGRNVLALQALTWGRDSFVRILPMLAAVRDPVTERDRQRTESLLLRSDGTPDPALAAYRDGRILARSGQEAAALEPLERAAELDPGAIEPVLARIACHRALGEHARAENLARVAIEDGKIERSAGLWRAWTRSVLLDRRRSPREALEEFPIIPPGVDPGRAAEQSADHRWLLETLAKDEPLRVDCGRWSESPGGSWSRDRFFLAGANMAAPGSETKDRVGVGNEIYRSERSFAGETLQRRGYRIPLPPGRYQVRLHFVEQTERQSGRRVFDVRLEGKTVLAAVEPLRAGFAVPMLRSVEVDVLDGALDLDFLAWKGEPRLAALEIEPGERP